MEAGREKQARDDGPAAGSEQEGELQRFQEM